eukprot:Skav233065  [mRNA]  locus=scaffold1468:67233:73083:- [translate_table: standard]
MISKVQANLLFLSSSKLELLQDPSLVQVVLLDAPPAPRHSTWEEFLARGGEENLRPVGAEHPALILFTSGTTGHPKGVLHSHGGCWSAINTSAKTFGVCSDDVVLVGKPITHAGGLQTQLLPTLMFGWPVLEGCGITEIGGYYAAQPLSTDGSKAGSMGIPTLGTQIRLVEDLGAADRCHSWSQEEHAAEALAAYECPVRYWQREAMPLNSVGKFDRSKLRAEAMAAMAAAGA